MYPWQNGEVVTDHTFASRALRDATNALERQLGLIRRLAVNLDPADPEAWELDEAEGRLVRARLVLLGGGDE